MILLGLKLEIRNAIALQNDELISVIINTFKTIYAKCVTQIF